MRSKSDLFLRVALIIGDGLMLILSFATAYAVRVHVDPRPFYFESQLFEFVIEIVWLVPIMLIVLAALGLYRKSVFLNKSRVSEVGRVFLAAVLSSAALIVYGYFTDKNLFPVKVIVVLTTILAFAFLMIERMAIVLVARQIFKKNYGTKRVIIIGNNRSTEYLAEYITSTPEAGYRLVGIVAGKKYIPKDLKTRQYSSLKDALRSARADVIFQTDEKSTEYVYRQAIQKHMLYYFVPSETALPSHSG